MLLVCGGGAHNRTLMQRLAQLLPNSQVSSTDVHGVPADWVEAMAFAWLAHCCLEGIPPTGRVSPARRGCAYSAQSTRLVTQLRAETKTPCTRHGVDVYSL